MTADVRQRYKCTIYIIWRPAIPSVCFYISTFKKIKQDESKSHTGGSWVLCCSGRSRTQNILIHYNGLTIFFSSSEDGMEGAYVWYLKVKDRHWCRKTKLSLNQEKHQHGCCETWFVAFIQSVLPHRRNSSRSSDTLHPSMWETNNRTGQIMRYND